VGRCRRWAAVSFRLYLAIYHGVFGLLSAYWQVRTRRRHNPFSRRALLLAPFGCRGGAGRARITGFPWNLSAFPRSTSPGSAHIATVTGLYGLSFEIMVVNHGLAAAVRAIARREARARQRKPLFLATAAANSCAASRKIDQFRRLCPRTTPLD